ncbi:atrial natriuretic peptide receptor 2-like [Scaptodrosophila lebanonensis]|uniref:Atrial natriuretic peptide receptor 2-like n=1 Tax=Drosophila lebanonensis TaxID=7225 RepID=A0A6J2UF59_DROLE|nr:atrial natriuretic peptide receptor 2-like [Scaptodrosophila lebanonensis]
MLIILVEKFESTKCVKQRCVTIIGEFRQESMFVENYLIESGSFVNVLWMGHKFRETVSKLNQLYKTMYSDGSKRFIILHWTPSDIIDAGIKYMQITLPRCEDFVSLERFNCKYELTSILKYHVSSLQNDKRLIYALRNFFISDEDLLNIMSDLNTQREKFSTVEDAYDRVACNWLRGNNQTYSNWINKDPITLWIGGIFPFNTSNEAYKNINRAVSNAVSAINKNRNVLSGYNLKVMENNEQCMSDVVMKAFIHYFNLPNMLGVLGPACSETVEPIAGISKHMNMMVLSYSAEGASFVDRANYPYFFRTIGSNMHYVNAYLSIMKKLMWQRVAAITEGDQKYSEYISHMEKKLKIEKLKLIIHRKLRIDVTPMDVKEYLLEIKESHVKIIIADIHRKTAAITFCEAKILGMIQKDEYVWFLPSWLSKDPYMWQVLVNNSCTSDEFIEALDGFSIMHTPFGNPEAIMQEGKTIRDWLELYNITHVASSNYIGFAYDAVWTYAFAAQKLLEWDKDAFFRLRSTDVVKKLADLIWETDFYGVSGKVKFGRGGSRINIGIDILQWRNMDYNIVGKFSLTGEGYGENISKNVRSGQLLFNLSKVHWLKDRVPQDGRYDCRFSFLAQTLKTDCDTTTMLFSIIMCMISVIFISVISFIFLKQRYDRKLKRSAKIMKTFGIDLSAPSQYNSNSLDKWEIPKDNVVVNRRLGEGAFGTVYGGEARLGSGNWTAVAVKTLKAGASTEDRVDFLSEAEAMKRFNHKNIIQLLAVSLQSEPIYSIMEFMLYGDLKTFLLARRNMVNDKVSDDSDISSRRLTMYAFDVARGLAYLADQKYVHRDLACRNCLVNAQRVVKIGDFGMARPTFETDYYRFNRKGMLPVRWMAPEALALGRFTPASDIWSFGVVLFEIISFGSYPYQGLTNSQVLEFVKKGNTLEIPIGIKPPLVGLINACWSQEASKRPTALEVIDFILNYPRLLTPSLDFPGAAVEFPEKDVDQLQLLPQLQINSPLNSATTLGIQKHTLFCDQHSSELSTKSESCPTASHQSSPCTCSPIAPDGYSIKCPLLINQTCDSSGS